MNVCQLDLANQQRNRRICYMIFNRQANQKILIKNKTQKVLGDIFHVKPKILNNPKHPNFDEVI